MAVEELETTGLQSFIDYIRQALQNPDGAQKEDLAKSLEQYGRHCDEANQRLRECLALIQQGQYSNAVALAERKPNLLDRCALLEIPEREILSTVALSVGAQPPALLNRNLVGAIQDAYQKDSTARSDLSFLQRLTLARAPLPTRLAVMRRLLVKNPNHPYMDTDIRTFEIAWFKQAPEFAIPYVKEGRYEVVEEIITDLEQLGYFETPPRSLIPALKGQLAKAQTARLPSLAEEIKQQFPQRNIATLKPLMQQWTTLTTANGVHDAAAKYGISDAQAWFDEIESDETLGERVAAAKATIASLLDKPRPTRQELERAYQTAKMLDPANPELVNRIQSRLTALRRQQTLRWGTYASAAVLLIAIISWGAYLLIRPTPKPVGYDRFVGELAQLIDSGQYEVAKTKIQTASSDLASEPKVVALLNSATQGSTKHKAFSKAMESIGKCRPDRDVQPMVDAARSNATTKQEQNQIDEAQQRWLQKRAALFETQVVELNTAAEQLRDDARRGRFTDNRQPEIDGIRERLKTLEADASRYKFEQAKLEGIEGALQAIAPWRTVAATVAQLAVDVKSANAEMDNRVLDRIASCLSDKIASVCPDNDVASRDKRAVMCVAEWKSILRSGQSLHNEPVAVDSLKNEWKDKPPSLVLEVSVQYSEMRRQRDASADGTAAYEMKAYLARREIADLWAIRRRGQEETYYTLSKPAIDENNDQVEVLLDINGKQSKIPFIGSLDIHRAPQAMFAQTIADLWKPSKNRAWHEELAKYYEALLNDDKIEPLLKLLLIKKLLNLAEVTSQGYQELLHNQSEFQALMSGHESSEGIWLDPGHELDAERGNAKKLIAQAPHLRSIASEAAQKDAQLLENIQRGLLVLGLLSCGPEGSPVLVRFAGLDPPSGSHLYTVVDGNWIEVGTFATGKEHLSAAAEQYFGWPIFSVGDFNK